MTKIRMWCMTIRIKKNDRIRGKLLSSVLLDFMMGAGISGATVTNGVDGFGKRGKSTLHIEAIAVNHPLVIEVVEEQAKLEPLLPQIKRIVGDNGLVTLEDVYAL